MLRSYSLRFFHYHSLPVFYSCLPLVVGNSLRYTTSHIPEGIAESEIRSWLELQQRWRMTKKRE